MTGSIDSHVDDDGVARITINRPEKRNALTHALMQALGDAVLAAEEDGAVRAILVGSPGPVFCAGADLGNLADSPPDADRDPGHRALILLATARKPLVAAVQGAAVGMGATMLLHFDAVYAAPEASLRMPFVELGLTPEAGATFLLPARIGHVAAARLMLLAEPVPAVDALRIGLFTAVVAADELAEAALGAARRLAAMPPIALVRTKAMMRWPDLEAHMDAEQAVFRALLSGREFIEGVAARQARLATKEGR
ncbi:MAG: enoyl-CoA hydratase/isomerase family protein [Sphingomonadaceae bacterium]|nr:enoyl-CoA hydratase/isomerase family protein [Sphingomonadaceae bacterium]